MTGSPRWWITVRRCSFSSPATSPATWMQTPWSGISVRYCSANVTAPASILVSPIAIVSSLPSRVQRPIAESRQLTAELHPVPPHEPVGVLLQRRVVADLPIGRLRRRAAIFVRRGAACHGAGLHAGLDARVVAHEANPRL